MTETEALIGLIMGAAGFVVAVFIVVGWAANVRRREDEDTRLGE